MWCKGYRGLCAGCIQVEDDEQFFEDDEDEKEDDVGMMNMRCSRISRSFTQCGTVQGSGA